MNMEYSGYSARKYKAAFARNYKYDGDICGFRALARISHLACWQAPRMIGKFRMGARIHASLRKRRWRWSEDRK
jgi:hypothetical protein